MGGSGDDDDDDGIERKGSILDKEKRRSKFIYIKPRM
jgi:hypothetical protein